MERVIAIDPPGCGCTECMVGEYVPLDEATSAQLMAMLRGELRNNTCRTLRVSTIQELKDDQKLTDAPVVAIVLAEEDDGEGWGRSWTIDPEPLAPSGTIEAAMSSTQIYLDSGGDPNNAPIMALLAEADRSLAAAAALLPVITASRQQ